MLGFGAKRIKARPAEVACALSFLTWQAPLGNPDSLAALIGYATVGREKVIEEMFSLQHFATMLGIVSGMPADHPKVGNMVSAMWDVHITMTGSPFEEWTAADFMRVAKFYDEQAAAYRRRSPQGWASVQEMRPYAPLYVDLANRHQEYKDLVSSSQDLELGLRAACLAFSENIGSGRNPAVSLTAMIMAGSVFKTVRDLMLNTYEIV